MSALTEYTWKGNPELVFNDTSTDPDNYYRITQYLSDTFVRNLEDERPNADGIIDYDSYYGKGILRIPVDIIAEDLASLNQMIANIKQSFNPRLLQIDAPTDSDIETGGYAPLEWTEVRGSTSLNLRILLKPLEIPRVVYDEKYGSGRRVELLLKAKDPFKESQTAKTITGAGSNTNAGDMLAYPIITIAGDTGANPKVTYSQTGEYIQIDNNLGAGDTVIIDCKNATVTKNGSNAYQYLNSGSTFFGLKSGTVTIALSDVGSATVTVAYRDTFTL